MMDNRKRCDGVGALFCVLGSGCCVIVETRKLRQHGEGTCMKLK